MPDPVDPHLPARLRAVSFVREGEERIKRGWFRAATSWLDAVRPGVMAPFREAGQLPDASAVSSLNQVWTRAIEEDVMPLISEQAQIPWEVITGHGEAEFEQDMDMVDYLQEARNRLSGVPDETYADITRIVQRGIDEGLSIPDIAREIQDELTATGSPQWSNRATTVARTETIGATNAGAFYGAAELAREREDPSPEKQWLSTIGDGRTRDTHVKADKQRKPLFEPFIVGGFPLMFPGDPSGPPQEVINCRCTLLDLVAGEEVDWTDRQFLDEDPWADSEDWDAPEWRLNNQGE